MNCGKSTAVLQRNHLLELAQFKPLLAKPRIDTRDLGVIKSRMGFEKPCFLLDEGNVERLLSIGNELLKDTPTHIIVDEAQFLSKKMVWALAEYVDSWNTNVECYGLRTSYTGELFEGSAALMAIADELVEMPSPSPESSKNVMHLRYIDDKPVFDGNPIHVGDIKDEYESVSRKRYFIERNRTN